MMTAEQLKNSILQLAMQGQLTIQKSSERVSQTFAPVKEDGPFDIPETWVWTSAYNCGVIVVGATPKTAKNEYWTNGDIKWLASGCCQDCQVFDTDKNLKMITQAGYDSCSTKIMPVDTVLIALTGATAGKVGLLKTEACANQSVVGITTVKDLLPEYLYYHLMSRRKEILDDCKGSAQPHISKKYITEMIIAVPPFEEQKRIVAKIEELMPFVEQYAEASTKLNTLNTSFPDMMKKSILQEAVQGKLVPQDPNDEPASELLKRIAEEKQRLIKEGKINREKALQEITEEEIPFDIPSNWKWARLGDLITVRGGKRLPAGKKLITEKTDHIYIRVTDMKNETVDMTDLHYLTEDIYRSISSYIIKKEDIFVVIVGSTIGKAGIIPEELDGMNLTENAARLTPYFVDKRFLLKMITGEFMQSQFIDRTHQVGQPKLALFRLKEALIPVPPVNEQKKIVAAIDSYVALIDAMRTEVELG